MKPSPLPRWTVSPSTSRTRFCVIPKGMSPRPRPERSRRGTNDAGSSSSLDDAARPRGRHRWQHPHREHAPATTPGGRSGSMGSATGRAGRLATRTTRRRVGREARWPDGAPWPGGGRDLLVAPLEVASRGRGERGPSRGARQRLDHRMRRGQRNVLPAVLRRSRRFRVYVVSHAAACPPHRSTGPFDRTAAPVAQIAIGLRTSPRARPRCPRCP